MDDNDKDHEFRFFNYSNQHDDIDLHNALLLDTESMVDVVCNKCLETKIWDAKRTIKITSNSRSIITCHKAHIHGYGDVWYSSNGLTNILSLANVWCKFDVTYEGQDGSRGRFTIHKPGGKKVYFNKHPSRLHFHDTLNCNFAKVEAPEKS